jgi:alpha-aminoadipate carrier protein LysW
MALYGLERNDKIRMSEAECVECGAEVALSDDLEAGEIIDCGTCGAELEVIDVSPPVLDRAPELEEDWGE